jgi:hypothetical protein
MSDAKGRESILLEEARKLKELVDRMIARLECGEPAERLSSEIDELRQKVIELLQGIEDIRMEDVVEKVKQQAADATKKIQDVLGNIGPSLDELSRKGQSILGDWLGKDTTCRDDLKAMIMSPDLTAEYFETMRRRNWSDQGIQESLDVLRQILLSRS